MKNYEFVKGSLEAIVWDPAAGKPLAEFIRGIFVTTDADVAKKLRKLGYRTTSRYPDGPPSEGFHPKPSDQPDLNAGDPSVNIKPAKSEGADLNKSKMEGALKKTGAGDVTQPEPQKKVRKRKVAPKKPV